MLYCSSNQIREEKEREQEQGMQWIEGEGDSEMEKRDVLMIEVIPVFRPRPLSHL